MSPQLLSKNSIPKIPLANNKKSAAEKSAGVSELLGKKIKNRFILNEFKEYLANVEHNSENLEFFIWLDQYKTVYSALAICDANKQIPAMTTINNAKDSSEVYTFFKSFNQSNKSTLLQMFKRALSGKKIKTGSSDSSETATVDSDRFTEGYNASIGRLSSLQSRKSNEHSWKTLSQTSITLVREENLSNRKSLSLEIQRTDTNKGSKLKVYNLGGVEGKSEDSPSSLENHHDPLNTPSMQKASDSPNSGNSPEFDLKAIDDKMNEIVPWEHQIEEIVKGRRTLSSFKSLSHRYTYDNPQRISHLLAEDNTNSICFDFVDELSIIHESFSIKISEIFNQEEAQLNSMNSSLSNLLEVDGDNMSGRTKSISTTSTFDKANSQKANSAIAGPLDNSQINCTNNSGSLKSSTDSNIDEAYQSQKSTANSSPQQAPQQISCNDRRRSVHVVPWELQLEEIENPDSTKYRKRVECEEITVPCDLPLADHITMCLKEFIFPGASKELNIPQKLRSDLYERIQDSTHPDIFGPIADHVYCGLRTQSFPAFMVYSAKKMTKNKLTEKKGKKGKDKK
ncbi:hypothetical protein CONCODRAFT_7667 [Conidiobolus coronatus NRRL 28638]|uniref:RGS domain-containing protein n=1 Tax=Conidiobolus coronatus (strain ATCC 28846 / CBS 209.66 / NRRL 28638) TaxID=796925 RepID=A0A137P4K2_CONC2|nr:hypothetical protein CONCODRAFT_7667 [Conidiobolus coronatus NRRL 28638]|eukprot:KXN69844.1 hypothetical protein CONCODRAFT_7667 [Conidiobolus coronatus NRRL 28638]